MPDAKATETPKLVSILCRTMGRPELAECLESVASQSYGPIELVLVNAGLADLSAYESAYGDLPVRIVNPESPLSRPAAANAGLDAARGDYLMFLDEDDWVDKNHVQGLVGFLEQQETVAAVYSSTRKVDRNRQPLDQTFEMDFDVSILRRDNYIPIHSMLFDANLLDHGCRFDESLPVYEDWDFWLQLSQHTPFAHLDQMSAYYRVGGESDTALDDESLRFSLDHPNAVARESVFEKWLPTYSAGDFNRILGSLDKSGQLDQLELAAREGDSIIRSQQEKLESLNETLSRQDSQLHALRHSHNELTEQHRRLKNHYRLAIDEFDYVQGQRDELVSQNRELQQEVESANAARQAMQTQFQDLEDAHSALHQQHQELDHGVRQLLASFSWRITAPYRFISNRFKRYVLQALTGGIKKSAVEVITKREGLHKAVRKTKAKAALLSKVSIHCSLESPSDVTAIFSDRLLIKGWAFSLLDTIDVAVHIDDKFFYSFQPDLERSDVAEAFSGEESALLCGFEQSVVLDFLAEGRHRLKLVFSDRQSSPVSLDREFYVLSQENLYNIWRQNTLAVAAPAAGDDTPLVTIALEGGGDAPQSIDSLRSVLALSYDKWRLCYIGADWDSILASLPDLERGRLEDLARSIATVQDLAQDLAPGDLLLTLAGGETLHPDALSEMVQGASGDDVTLVYSDHDAQRENCYQDPVFTFGWSPEHLLGRNYVGGVFLLRCDEQALTQLREGESPDWRYALLLSHSRLGIEQVARIPRILWSERLLGKDATNARALAEFGAASQYLSQQPQAATLEQEGGIRYVEWPLAQEPLVSIIIPTMGKLDLLKPCLESLLEHTTYNNYELVMLDNSRGKFPQGIEYLRSKELTLIECDEDFNWSRLNNVGARHAQGELLLFLNDDIEVIQPDWLQEMVKQARREEVGAVGSLLFYPNGAMQHAGVLLVNHGGGCAHLFHKMNPDPRIYRRLDRTVREVSANTGACLMLHRDKFEQIGGFDEELAVVGNDVDLCLRLLDQGYRNIWTPHCRLVHHESISRKAVEPQEDKQAMWQRWGHIFERGDSYYNPQLTQLKWDCSAHMEVPLSRLQEHFADIPPTALESAEPQPGVTLIGYIRAEMGLGEAARSDARALAAACIDFNIVNFAFGNPSRMNNQAWRSKESLELPYEIVLMHINPDFLAMAKRGLPRDTFAHRYLIAFWAWELEQIPEAWNSALALVDEVWVPSEFVNSAVSADTELPVVTIPHCVSLEPRPEFTRDYFDLPSSCYVFLAMFDTNSVAERKNPFAAINAFKQAFSGADATVCLLLKVNNSTGRDESDLQAAIASYPNIRIMREAHSRMEIDGLLNQIDCYVSLHRSEGFGLGPAEAMSLGKAAIITNWSGSTDYMTEDNCLPIDYQLVELKRDYGPYKKGQRWAAPDIQQAAQAMARLAADPALGQSIGKLAKESMARDFSSSAVGARIRDRLASIAQARRDRNQTS